MTRNLLLSLTALAAVSASACATTPAPQAQVTVAAPQPVVQQQPVYQQPSVPIVAVPGAVVGGPLRMPVPGRPVRMTSEITLRMTPRKASDCLTSRRRSSCRCTKARRPHRRPWTASPI